MPKRRLLNYQQLFFPSRISFALLIILLFPFRGWSQYYKETIATLASPTFNGRGYYKQGDHRAAKFIEKEFKRFGLQPFSGSYLQHFSFSVNTFPGKMKVKLDEKTLTPGEDFIVSPACPQIKGTFPVLKLSFPLPDFKTGDFRNTFIIIDKSGMDSTSSTILDSLSRNPPDVGGVIVVENTKLTWSVSQRVGDIPFLRIMSGAIPQSVSKINLNIQTKYIPEYKTANVLGYVPGKTYPDSFIVFTAHYDHLGRMGKSALFAGANDNASGTSMVLDLARYYSLPENKTEKSILFIAFAGEEAGLVGSKYYTDNPLFPLKNINFLINLDLMGNGSEGVMVVNGELHENHFNQLDSINGSKKLLSTVGKRGTAKNSDHYWFSHNGVPAFFLYTMGGSKAYHDIYDTPEQLPLTEFDDIEILLKEFVKGL